MIAFLDMSLSGDNPTVYVNEAPDSTPFVSVGIKNTRVFLSLDTAREIGRAVSAHDQAVAHDAETEHANV